MPRTSLADNVDQLGWIKAKIANLKQREDQLKAVIVASGKTAAEGNLFRVTVSRSEVAAIDWKAIAAKMHPSVQLITAHTSHADRDTVRCVAKTGRPATA